MIMHDSHTMLHLYPAQNLLTMSLKFTCGLRSLCLKMKLKSILCILRVDNVNGGCKCGLMLLLNYYFIHLW